MARKEHPYHRLRYWQRKRGYSNRAFAKLIRKKYENTIRYDDPDYDPKLSTLRLWAEKLEVKVRDLIRE